MINFELERQKGLLYSKMPEHKRLVDETKLFIKKSLSKVSNPYVACSFGKDSSVMLHLILQEMPKIRVRFASHPETELLDKYKQVIDWWINEYNINLYNVFCNGDFVKIKHHQRDMLDDVECDSFFVGIRAEESRGRRISLKKDGKFYKLKSNGRIKISPMAWWKKEDIWAYIVSNNIPLLDKYEFEGVTARTTSGIARYYQRETLLSLKQRDITRYNKLLQLYPNARNYT